MEKFIGLYFKEGAAKIKNNNNPIIQGNLPILILRYYYLLIFFIAMAPLKQRQFIESQPYQRLSQRCEAESGELLIPVTCK